MRRLTLTSQFRSITYNTNLDRTTTQTSSSIQVQDFISLSKDVLNDKLSRGEGKKSELNTHDIYRNQIQKNTYDRRNPIVTIKNN